MLYQQRGEGLKLANMLESVKSVRQQAIAKKPRNPHYSEAIRIADATWKKYSGASKAKMCENLYKYFGGKVGADTLDRWIKDAGIQPPRPEKFTSFTLVT